MFRVKHCSISVERYLAAIRQSLSVSTFKLKYQQFVWIMMSPLLSCGKPEFLYCDGEYVNVQF